MKTADFQKLVSEALVNIQAQLDTASQERKNIFNKLEKMDNKINYLRSVVDQSDDSLEDRIEVLETDVEMLKRHIA
jgi:peptidoglycan hydrolase CwlO-like protein